MAKPIRAKRLIPERIDWSSLLEVPLHESGGQMLSTGEVILRKRYSLDLLGDIAAIRDILKMARLNEAARRAQEAPHINRDDLESERRRRHLQHREEHMADPALMLLGIGVVDNDTLHALGEPADPGFTKRVAQLQPTHLAQWVVDYARTRSGFKGRRVSPHLAATVLADDDPKLSEWPGHHDWLSAQLVAVRGPGATRFQQGVSPNPRGRPRGRKRQDDTAAVPFDRFFSELTTVPVRGELIQMTRLDAMIWKLLIEAGNGDERLQKLLIPLAIDQMAAKWEPPIPHAVSEDFRG